MGQELSSLPLQGGTELLAWNHNIVHDRAELGPGITEAGTLLCKRAPPFQTQCDHIGLGEGR